MIHRIFVSTKIDNTKALIKKKELNSLCIRGTIKDVYLVEVYSIDKNFNRKNLEKISLSLTNSISQLAVIDKIPALKQFSYCWKIGFLPGVTDNVGNTAREIISDLLKINFSEEENVYTSQITFINALISKKDALEISANQYNPLIQKIEFLNALKYQSNKGFKIYVPKVILKKTEDVLKVDLNVNKEELINIGKLGIKNLNGHRRGPLALDLNSLLAIRDYFNKLKRLPNDIELESLAQTWSEHCKHNIFRNPLDEMKEGLFKSYIQRATDEIIRQKKNNFCVSVFTDNSGAIKFTKDHLITHKVETHNSPSALDPFGGAVTGICGVNRDCLGFGMGAKPIANTYGFCLANPLEKNIELYREKNKKQPLLSTKRIMEGVIRGVNNGGNCSGIPTSSGFLYFDNRFRAKPLVFVGTVGLIPYKVNNRKSFLKKAQRGDYIVIIGGRVGKDGIHGATFSSEALSANSPSGAVQIGDPITQKKLSDTLIKEARDQNLYHSITDNGAGGLSCSVSEMAKESNGCEVDLDKVPLKYSGLEPWQIWISESQERMTLAVPGSKLQKFKSLTQSRGVEASVIGKFTDSGKCVVKYRKKVIMDLNLLFLHKGQPLKILKSRKPKLTIINIRNSSSFAPDKKYRQLLAHVNICGFSFVSSQYDHEVQGTSVLKPLQGRGLVNGETTVIKPLLGSQKGVALSFGLYPRYTEIDPYNMSACCIDTAVRNIVSIGGNLEKIALLDNFCWCDSLNPERLWQLKESVKACYDYAVSFQTPFISGKDSMFNDFSGFDSKGNKVNISILPTLLISSMGIIDDIKKIISEDAKFPDDLIYILGETSEEMAGSEYYSLINDSKGRVPVVNSFQNIKNYRRFYICAQKDLISGSLSITKGGLGIALAKMSLAGKLGIEVSLKKVPGIAVNNESLLYSETQGRILFTVAPKNKLFVENILKGLPYAIIGKVTDHSSINIKGVNKKEIINLEIDEGLKLYRQNFKDL